MPAPTCSRLIPLSALIALTLVSSHAVAETFTWGGGNGYWDELNWTSTGAPDDDAAVVFVDGGKDGVASLVQVRIDRFDNNQSASSLFIDSGDTVEVVAGTLTLYDALTVSGTLRNLSSFRMRAGVSAIAGSGAIENRSNSFVGEQITLGAGVTLFNEGFTRFQALNIRGDYRAQGAEGPSLTVSGILQQNGRLLVASGTDFSLNVGNIASGSKAIEVESSGVLRLDSDEIISGQHFVASGGTASFSGRTLADARFSGDWEIRKGSTSATMRDRLSVEDSMTIYGVGGASELRFASDFELDGGGTYRLVGGRIVQTLGDRYTLTLANGTTLEGYGGITSENVVNQGRLIAGTGSDGLTINAESVVNEGIMDITDSDGAWGLYVGSTTRGSFVQTAAGRLVFHFDDTVPSDQGIMRVYDATLDGTAELMFDAPPEIGVWYTGMWAAVGKINGQFADVVAPSGWSIETRYEDRAVSFRVTAVPEPETLALFAAGLGLIGAVARRRMV
ncbi:PEP-CTERM sorting domain-containing protein [Methyloversatilis discipulorum]|uniref:PEP-CTERM sorting domain-containing protein n=1 Tax=Methyloversatilis discipulorum TaxID=1119528 RepID=UPI00035DD718|nr:PEP-CTERM sorting domain-containing protein [Methyloversatilis discipulorum]